MKFSFGSKSQMMKKVFAGSAGVALMASLLAAPAFPPMTAASNTTTPTPSGAGYWMVSSDGGVFSFGDAGYYGSLGGTKLNKPITGMLPTPSGKGYWLVASDGGLFSFGDATFYGSAGSMDLTKPIVGMATTGSGGNFSAAGVGAAGPRGSTGDTGASGASGARGAPGDVGDTGPAGAKGSKGDSGKDATYVGADWSIIDRNVIGSGASYLRSGPATPPMGIGSLGIRTGSATDKSAFGNSTVFAGLHIGDLTKVGFSVYTTGENRTISPANLPSLSFEIDPNLAAKPTTHYASLVFMPDDAAANAWTTIDATTSGHWGLTGSAFTGTPCDINGARCTFAQMKDYLTNDDVADSTPAVVTYSTAFTKGRDNAFSGAVDGLMINNRTFDFEPFGVLG